MRGITNAVAEKTGEKKQMTLPKKGPRVGILSGIIDVGIQQREWKGENKAPCREFIPIYTLVSDTYEDEGGVKRHCAVRPFPMALKPGMSKSNYFAWAKTLDPDGEVLDENAAGDITKLIGRAAFIPITYTDPDADGLIYANTKGSITQIPEDYPIADIEYNKFIFDTGSPDKEMFDGFTSYVQGVIRGSVDYAGSELEAALEGEGGQRANEEPSVEEDDDCPV